MSRIELGIDILWNTGTVPNCTVAPQDEILPMQARTRVGLRRDAYRQLYNAQLNPARLRRLPCRAAGHVMKLISARYLTANPTAVYTG